MKRMLRGILALLIVCVVAGAGLFAAVCICARQSRTAVKSDCIIVLGAKVWPDGRMSHSLLYRCESALEAWRSGLAQNIIVCGAQGGDEPAAEADVMAAWLVKSGVPEESVRKEAASVNTRENLENAAEIMAERGWKTAIIATNDYHVQRALWIAGDVGIDACAVAARSPGSAKAWLLSRVREPVSWVLYWLRKL
ncbi:MAG: YdcF family protein [Candidatus Faecivicinus sp.]